jgi:uncharacterized membrane protein YbhN (UPF0104 family)
MTPQTRTRLLNLARILISAVLLAWVLSQAGLEQLAATARRADLRLYGLAVALAFLGIVVRAARWHWLLRSVGARVSFGRAVYLYFIGAFFNTFLPTGFGGDVVRVLEIGPGATSQQAAGTALVDRLTGFIMLFVLALAALPFGYHMLPANLALLIAALAAAVLVGSALLFEGRLIRRLTRWLPAALSPAGDAWIGRTYAVITACGVRGVGGALLWSLLFNVQLIVESVLVSRALGLTVPASIFFLFVPVTTAALLVPISIAGLGVREGLYVTLLGQVGVGAAEAVALSLATYSLDVAMGLVGGGVYLVAGLAGLRGGPARPAP